ncbi:ribosome assembly factor SBDS [Candidatus Woesearchaeota archaeon]|jgi:ribosome maturation protein SDO1|nr:ribosome assembly factor SBDS [Candidatus Woesearchaeota archaeon]MBT5111780.1 ribosome assembly factor SBDS [Candidatus Woesearchaeota archaeon]MBT5557958.1 ribosome assembly factor SBDS [Candidatus Woesearchaeota archaeon]
MVDVDKAVIARLKKGGKHFEIKVDCDKALEFKEGKNVSFEDILATTEIYFDVKKGEKASTSDFQEVFQTEDVNEVITKILKEGEIQLTTKHRESEKEAKLKKLINLVHVNAVDSKTGYPHPLNRIENAISESKFRIDENRSADEQLEGAIKELRAIIPIKLERKEVEIKIPASYGGQAKGIVHKHKVKKEEWLSDGSYYSIVEIPSGILDEFFDELNKISHGQVESKILKIIE